MSFICSVAHEDQRRFYEQNKEDLTFLGDANVCLSFSFCFTAMIACALFYRFVNFDCLDTFLIIKTLFLDTDSFCYGEMNPCSLISSEREALARGGAIATAGRVTWRSHDRVQR